MPTLHYSSKFHNLNISSGYQALAPFNPSDAFDVPVGPGGNNTPCVGFVIGGAGNVNVDLPNGGTALFTGLAAGQIVDCAVKRIRSTSTTATGVLPLYALRH